MESFHVAFDQQQKAKKNKIIWSLLLTLSSRQSMVRAPWPACLTTHCCVYNSLAATKQGLCARHSAYASSTNPQRQCPDSHFIDEESEVFQRNHSPNMMWVASLKFKPVPSSSRYYTLEKPEKLDVFSSKVYIWNWNIWSVTSEWIFYTLDPWTTRVWTVQVHLYTGFFFPYMHICSSMQSAISWIPRCRIMDMEADGKIMWFLTTWKVACPNPHVIQGSIVFQKSGWFLGCDYLKTSTS